MGLGDALHPTADSGPSTLVQQTYYLVIFLGQLEETPEMPPSSRDEGLLFLPGLESNHESSLNSEEEAGLP